MYIFMTGLGIHICIYFKHTHPPDVQVWNANFKHQMVHQCGLFYNDLGLCHFLVSSTGVRRTLVINWKSVFSIVLCSIFRYLYWTKRIHVQHEFFCFHVKKTADESYWLLKEAYGDHAPSQDTMNDWLFWRFKSGDFDVADKEYGKLPKKYYELLKPGRQLILNVTNNNFNYSLLKKWPEHLKDNTKWFFFITKLHHIQQNQFVTCWKHSDGKFYPMRLAHQTSFLQITTCMHRWVTHLL